MSWLDEVGQDMSDRRVSNINVRRGAQREPAPDLVQEEHVDDPADESVGIGAVPAGAAVSINFADNVGMRGKYFPSVALAHFRNATVS